MANVHAIRSYCAKFVDNLRFHEFSERHATMVFPYCADLDVGEVVLRAVEVVGYRSVVC